MLVLASGQLSTITLLRNLKEIDRKSRLMKISSMNEEKCSRLKIPELRFSL